jgi:hypothetical protein
MNGTAPKQIAYCDFVDDTRRAVLEDERGQFVLDDDRERLYGTWLARDARPDGGLENDA